MRAAWLVVLALAGCAKVEAFECAGDSQCAFGSKAGVCEPSGYCSFPDGTCPQGKRYGEWAGDGLAGSCVEGGSPTTGGGECEECGPCEACVAGACAPLAAGEACELECSDVVFGLGDEAARVSCLAGASGPAAGTCDADGVCVVAEGACAAGAEIVGCDATCARADHNCTAGTPVGSVTAASLCTTGAPTANCKATCTDVMNGASLLEPRICDANGACVAQAAGDCGAYICADTLDACRTSCTKQSECAQGFMCAMNTMTCE